MWIGADNSEENTELATSPVNNAQFGTDAHMERRSGEIQGAISSTIDDDGHGMIMICHQNPSSSAAYVKIARRRVALVDATRRSSPDCT
jgi:hypothetical protein